MIDQHLYSQMFDAAFNILKSNGSSLGREFCEGFMFDHDLRNGQEAQRNAANMFNAVANEAQRLNGNSIIRDNNQLFEIVGSYIKYIYGVYTQRQQQRGSFGGGGSMFGGGSTMGGGSMFGGNRGGGFSNFSQPRTLSPGSHLSDDTIEPRNQPIAQAAPQPAAAAAPAAAASSMFSFTPQKETNAVSSFSTNPLDDLSSQGVDFSPVKVQARWGDEKAKDRRIIVGRRFDMKTRDAQYTVNMSEAYHQLIMNDPMDVMRDFFEIVPDSTLGSPFLFKIFYNHLETIDVPTADFVNVRNRCIEGIKQDSQVLLHKKIAEVINDMKRGPYVALTKYLTSHVNRALHLACRLSNNPVAYIRIGDFEDIDELLSSSFKHEFTAYPEGRHKLEKIVGGALWNALVMSANAMFVGDETFPTHAVQSSPAFPYSMEGVYPNKYSIPTPNDAMIEQFRDKLTTVELSKRTYILSKRSVVVTNIFGRHVLSTVKKDPTLINTPLAQLINRCVLPFDQLTPDDRDVMVTQTSLVEEGFPSDQLERYYEDPIQDEIAEIERYGKVRATELPLDQTIFAVQYSVDPKDYLTALDVFTTIDGKLGKDQTILSTKTVKDLTITA